MVLLPKQKELAGDTWSKTVVCADLGQLDEI